MGYFGADAEQNVAWRKAAFVVSYPGDHRSYATGTLHRPTCRTLRVEARLGCHHPSKVYEQDLARFTKDANDSGIGGQSKVCQLCCADIKVTGQRMIAPPPPKEERMVTAHVTMKRSERDALLRAMGTPTTPIFIALAAALRAAK